MQQKDVNSDFSKMIDFEQIKRLFNLIGEGHKRIGDQKEDKAILIMGETGAGKSTLTYLLAGKNLTAMQNDEGEFYIDTVELIEEIKIGHDKVSETKIPCKIKTENGCVIWDCPGFADLGRDAIQDITNAFYIQRLFDTTNELKFVLTIPECHMKMRGADLLRVVTHFVKIFKEIEDIKDRVTLIITHAPPGKTPEHFKRTLEKILEENISLDSSNRKMLEYLLKSIEVFHQPTRPGSILEFSAYTDKILNTIENNSTYLKTKPGSANVVISRNSEELAEELFNKSSQTLRNLLTEFTGKIKAICDQVENKGNEISELSKVFQLQAYDIEKAHYKELLNLESIIIFNNFCSLALIQKGTVEEWLTLLDQGLNNTISVLEQYYQGSEKLKILNIEYQIKENLGYLRFISKVCESKTVNLQDFMKIFEACKEAIDNASLKGAESIILESKERSQEYYQTVIRFLDMHSNSSKCKEVKAQAYYYVAVIQKSEKKFGDAIESCAKSLEINESSIEPLDLIDDICINDNALLEIFSQNQWPCSINIRHQVLTYLDQKNDKIFLETLSEIKVLINTALETEPQDKSTKLMVFIENLWDVLSAMVKASTKNDISVIQFGDAITQVAIKMVPAISKDLLQKIDLLIKYLNALRRENLLSDNISGSSGINTWITYLDTKKASDVLCVRIKELDLENGDLVYYRKVIKYASLQTEERTRPWAINLAQDPKCKDMIALAYCKIGRIKQNEKDYAEAVNYHNKAIEMNENLEQAYRGLDEIYFITGKIVTQKTIIEKLTQFNIGECSRIFNERLTKFYQDYITDRKYFTQANKDHVSYLDYLDNLNSLNVSLLELDISVKKKDWAKFLEALTKIFKILAKDANENEIRDEIKKSNKIIAESINKDNGLFTLDTLARQFGYIRALSSNWDQNIHLSLNKWVKPFDYNQLQDMLKEFVRKINLYSEEKDCSYYKKVISHIEKYNSDKDCVSINVQSHLCLAKRAEDKNEEIQYYLTVTKLNDRLLELVRGQDNEFYSTYPIKKQAYDKLGEIYFNDGKIEDAIQQFKMVGNHIKIKKCFKALINSGEDNYSYREQKGDYLSGKGMVDSAVDCYYEALSLTTDHDVYARINKKIATVLESDEAEAIRFKRKAEFRAINTITI